LTDAELPREYLIVNDDGMPTGFMNIDVIQATATRFAFEVAAASANTDRLDATAARYLGEAGPDTFGYVSTEDCRRARP
jgi:hypothetical protein